MIPSTEDDEGATQQPAPQDDPWQEEGQDPWAHQEPLPSQAAREERPPPPRSFAAVTLSGQEPPPTRIVHDIPPTWGGENPEKELEPYLKLLKGWLACLLYTSPSPRDQRGSRMPSSA